nr:unnamed protein product [Spirometra erinaceieuropaei]
MSLFGHMRVYESATDRSPYTLSTSSTPIMPSTAHAPPQSAFIATSSIALSTLRTQQFATMVVLSGRGRIGFFAGHLTQLQKEVFIVQPTLFTAVPQVLARIE